MPTASTSNIQANSALKSTIREQKLAALSLERRRSSLGKAENRIVNGEALVSICLADDVVRAQGARQRRAATTMTCSASVVIRQALLPRTAIYRTSYCAAKTSARRRKSSALLFRSDPTFGSARRLGTHSNGGGGRIKIWEFRVADELQMASTPPPTSDSADCGVEKRSKKQRLSRTRATLYIPSVASDNADGRGWTTIDTTLGCTIDYRVSSGKMVDAGACDALNKPQPQSSSLIDNLTHQLERHVLRHFLPAGYPSSVAPGYRNYVLYCFSANVCGSAAMVLSTQTLLLAVGVGSSEAAPLAAGLNWVMKDGIGQLGGILFASRLGSAATGSSIDSDPKRWRVASAISMDGATWLEILSPLFPGYFLPIASVANIGKNIGFLTASASRAAIHNALTLRTNLGDVTAKAGSQSIAASLVGTALGIGLSPLMQGEVANVAVGFAVLSVFHQYCTYKACRSVPLRSLNRHRMSLVLEEFVKSYVATRGVAGLHANHTVELLDDEEVTNVVPIQSQLSVLTPAEVAKIEQFLPFISKDETKQWLRIGCRLEELFSSHEELDTVRRDCIGERETYLLNHESNDTALIRLTYLDNASGLDVIRGMLHVHILRSILQREIVMTTNAATPRDSIKTSHGLMAESFDAFMEALEKGGWDTGAATIQVEAGSAVRLRIDRE